TEVAISRSSGAEIPSEAPAISGSKFNANPRVAAMNAMYPNRLSAMIHHSRVVRNFRNSERTTPGRPPDTGAVRVAVLTVVLLRGYRQLFRMRRRAERCAGHLLVLGTLLL